MFSMCNWKLAEINLFIFKTFIVKIEYLGASILRFKFSLFRNICVFKKFFQYSVSELR